ncbi:putative mannosylphosphate transferase (Mnn4) [Aspergillus brunneoviolaceus CBS 621.78]|uniref:Mannosylphosphate transferase n=1 Tax=Aspergillus brunneoviolaceus CBS 621.78 TaxID=1450534 RepID=A0ACD1FRH1_9EURO|nr:mannosylphosphate transferase [Aspergillus brunneoviolaceus CBS 621.78]RAH39573.1 mannosylphosphate transferase [Aspergillus brunneoviolaceus CBS 621.78]
MKPQGLLAVVCTIGSLATATTVTALPNSQPQPAVHHTYGELLNHNDPDPLYEQYGLNRSEEFKYFQEPGNDDILGHYDSRFFTEPVPDEERSHTLTHMIRAYLNFFEDNGLETWIAHGTLLGWWWNGKVMPWDWDIDTQVMEPTLFQLADHYNQTVVQYTAKEENVERKYLVDVNPWARQRDRGKGLNIIDARWIDMNTGLYIDITGLSRLDATKPTEWQCKNLHKYQTDDIYPLRRTTFEGVPAKVPFKYDQVLEDEYSKKALTNTHYHDHTFDPEVEEWLMDEPEPKEKEDDKDDRQYE